VKINKSRLVEAKAIVVTGLYLSYYTVTFPIATGETIKHNNITVRHIKSESTCNKS